MAEVGQETRFIASMVLSGVGDAIGYKNGSWEFCHSGQAIHDELKKLGGLQKIKIKLPGWMVSDDTVMHLATGEALVNKSQQPVNLQNVYDELVARYKHSFTDMSGRAPGATCMNSVHHLKTNLRNGHRIPFNPRGGGCGAAMRAMCIGLRFYKPEDEEYLIAVAVESGRMTHHHPTGYLGALAAALFTAYSIQGKPVREWGHGLLSVLPRALEHIQKEGWCVKENEEAWTFFAKEWQNYLEYRGILDGQSDPVFHPKDDSVQERDKFYKSLSWGKKGWAGSSGHDAPMISYDALLAAGSSWEELCNRAMFHYGDSDSTGVIAGACFGAMYGFEGVPENNYKKLEYRDRLETIGKKLYELSQQTAPAPSPSE